MAGRSLTAAAQPRVIVEERTPTEDDGKRIRELDGIRAIAILMVLLNHALGDPSQTQALHGLSGWNAKDWVVVGHLWLGVDLFFVLSGFLITGILLDSRRDAGYYKNFYVRRGLRILPVLVAVLAFAAIVFHGPPAYYAMALLFCANFATYLNVIPPPGLGPLWSLGVEEQFYLLWPTFVRKCSKEALMWIAAAVCVAVPCLRILSADPSHELLLTWMRCNGLAMGALVAIFVKLHKPGRSMALTWLIGALGVTLLLFTFESHLRNDVVSRALRPSEADLLFGAAVLAAFAYRGSRVTAILRSPLAAFVAGTSYCAYLIHLMVFKALDVWGLTASTSVLQTGGLRLLWGLPLIFAIAALSKRFLEDPVLRLKTVLAPREAPS